MHTRHINRGGFALPTVLIASVVMLMVLAASVSSVVAVRNNLQTQYYEQLAKAAGEAGVAYAKACLSKNGNVPLWTDAKPLTPATDCAGNSLLSNNPFSALVVAGGGGGGGSTGGGGGGGGVIENDYFALNTGSYGVTVGAGGATSGNQKAGNNGANSVFNGWSAIGGGGGGYSAGGNSGAGGKNGGSGGGGQSYFNVMGPGSGTAGQGYAGGSMTGVPGQSTTGGGGAGGVGLQPSGDGGGAGGPGVLSTITGAAVYYGGGGGGAGGHGGCGGNSGSGGIGGGGNGGDVGTPGTPNSGGGGGGGWCYASGNGGAGGSGVVIISYPNNGAVTASGGDQVYVAGPNKVHIFKSSGTFTVSAVGTSSCPSDPRCSVVVDGNMRSSFSVGKPTLDADGKAVTIPNSGYVELLRSSNGAVWRTYRQPSVQAAVVPDLCSGAATSELGWVPVVSASTQDALPNASGATTVTVDNSPLPAGVMYFRKDFVISATDTYSLSALTPSTQDKGDVYIDGSYVTTTQGSLAAANVPLSAGCHTMVIQLTNQTLLSRASRVTASLQRSGSAPIVATDTSWRVSTGKTVHFSDPDYYADPNIWTGVVDFDLANSLIGGWAAATGDAYTHFISSSCTNSCPPSSSTYFRDSRDFVLTANASVQVSASCDDDCTIYVDGTPVIQGALWSSTAQQTISLTPGSHRVGARLYNSGSAVNPSKFAVTLRDADTGTVLARTDSRWQTANNTWVSGTNPGNDPVSYDATFTPSPQDIATTPTYDVLVVAGGGGGGGNCNSCGGAGGGGGGGTIFQQGVTATTGARSVTVGVGGSAGAGGASRANGGNGGDSVFGSIVAKGGGGGGAQTGGPGNNGGSGGGGSGGGSPAPGAGGSGLAGQGGSGGAGRDAAGSNYNGGGGGGAGGFGMLATQPYAGDGGPGMLVYLTGLRLLVGPGGGAGVYNTYGPGSGEDGAGNGASASVNNGNGYAAAANSGGGGGGGNGNNKGGAGGAGGSGIVIVRYKTGTLTATGGSMSQVTIDGIRYTIHTFTSGSSTFTITGINQ